MNLSIATWSCKWRYISTIAFCSMVFLAGYMWLLGPLIMQCTLAKQREQELLSRWQQRQFVLQTWHDHQAKTQAQLLIYQQQISIEMSLILNQIALLAEQIGVQIKTTNLLNPEIQQNQLIQPLQIIVEGDYLQFLQFLQNLQSIPGVWSATQLSIEQMANGLQMSMQLNFYQLRG